MKRNLILKLEELLPKKRTDLSKSVPVRIIGKVLHCRNVKSDLTFLVIEDKTYKIQVVLPYKFKIPILSMLDIKGLLKYNREQRVHVSPIEIHCNEDRESIKILSEASKELPFDFYGNYNLDTAEQHKAVSLQTDRSKLIFKVSEYLTEHFRDWCRKYHHATEINSTKLTFQGMEGGSELFEVDYFGKKAYLSQSPQLFKQMMCNVYETVFEIGRVYRAEGSKSSRHLAEYIGLDFESMPIDSMQEIIEVAKGYLTITIPSLLSFSNLTKRLEKEFSLNHDSERTRPQIPQLTYKECMNILGREEDDLEGLSHTDELHLGKYVLDTYNHDFVIITHYPMCKRPFYTMLAEDPNYTESFDILYKGLEITSGGQRIHDHDILVTSMEAAGLKPANYKEYLEIFKYGAAPHGGFGMGLERILAQILNIDNVRECSLIPRYKK